MKARDLIEILGAGDLDDEVYVALPGGREAVPVGCLDDETLGPDAGETRTRRGVVLYPTTGPVRPIIDSA